jgi:hypothetical protein
MDGVQKVREILENVSIIPNETSDEKKAKITKLYVRFLSKENVSCWQSQFSFFSWFEFLKVLPCLTGHEIGMFRRIPGGTGQQ